MAKGLSHHYSALGRLSGEREELAFSYDGRTLPDEVKFLAKMGNKFILKHCRTTPETLQEAMKKFKRRIFIKHAFRHKNEDNETPPKGYPSWRAFGRFYIANPDWKPPTRGVPEEAMQILQDMDTLLKEEARILVESFKPTYKSKHARLHTIVREYSRKEDQRLVEADKNLGLACINETDYQDGVMVHLNNPKKYIKITEEEVQEIIKRTTRYAFDFALEVGNILYGRSASWRTMVQKYLYHHYPDPDIPPQWAQVPKFRGVPKLHKGMAERSLRPIASAGKWISQPLGKIIATGVEELLSYETTPILRDSQALIEQLENHPCHTEPGYMLNRKLVSIDVVALYPSIEPEDVIQVFEEWIPEDFYWIVQLLHRLKDTMVVSYKGEYWRQSLGLAMGASDAVSLANTYLWKRIDSSDTITKEELLEEYRRYLDDGFGFWLGSIEQWDEFKKRLNKIHPSLQFTSPPPGSQLIFLDIFLYITSDYRLEWAPYSKPLGSYTYLSPLSQHPTATVNGYVKGELIRLKRHSSTTDAYREAALKFYVRLLRRGFKASRLIRIFLSAVDTHKRTHKTTIPLVLPYDDFTSRDSFQKDIRDHLHKLKQYFPEVVLTYTRGPHLIDQVRRI